MNDDVLRTSAQSEWGAKPQEIVQDISDSSNLVPKEPEDDFKSQVKEMLKKEEGLSLKAYKPIDSEEHFTQGYGRYGPSIKEGSSITEEQADIWLEEDISKRISAVNKSIPKFGNLPIDTRVALFSSWYRGGLSGSPATIKLINKGEFSKAADEFLNNDEYRRLKKSGKLKGVIKRMERVHEQLNQVAAASSRAPASLQIKHFMQGE